MNLPQSFEDDFLQDPLYLNEIGGDQSQKTKKPRISKFCPRG